jgi:CheY-like chemotaxis protein
MLPTHVCHKRILVVEDNFILSETLSTLLGADGYRVCAASDGQEALERLSSKDRPDLVILDLMMPVKDGFAFLKERQQKSELTQIPVIVVSGATDLKEQATALGASVYLAKPVDPTELLQAVRRYCP